MTFCPQTARLNLKAKFKPPSDTIKTGDIMDSKTRLAVTHNTVTSGDISANECLPPLQFDTMEAAAALRTTEASVWNGRKRGDDVRLPGEQTRGLIMEILWWHNAFGNPVTYGEIHTKCRSIHVAYARADCMRRLREVKGWSYPRIGKYFGMDHTTIMHHCRKAEVATAIITLDAIAIRASQQKYERAKEAKQQKLHALGGTSSTAEGASNEMG